MVLMCFKAPVVELYGWSVVTNGCEICQYIVER